MPEESPENKIANIIKTIRSWSLLWDLDELFKEVIKNSVELLNADFGYLLLLESNGLSIKSQWATRSVQQLPYITEIVEKVIRHGQAIYAPDILRGAFPKSQIYCVPLTANRGVLGVIYIEISNQKEEITQDEKLIFEMLGLQAASFLENSILYHSAIIDPLTRLYSHRHFQQECDQLIKRASRTQSNVSMIIMDLDHFKQLNDKFGHEEGNDCLKRISDLLRNKFRSSDIIARFGGDEFEILLPNTSSENCYAIAIDLLSQIKNEKFPLQISGTIGIATFPLHANDSQSLFLAADQALYIGKKNGRNCATISNFSGTKIEGFTTKFKDLNDLNIKREFSLPNATTENIKKDVQKIDGLDIISRIASSSNGEVLLVKQHELERFVALKRPLTAYLTEDQSNSFKKEAFLTASLSHPGVAPLYTMGQGIDGRLYYTMKPIKGKSLEDLLNNWFNKDTHTIKEYNLIKIIHILLKTAETVAYAHSRSIAHLDIHPGNIIIGEFGEITLIDWGKGSKLSDENQEKASTGIYVSGSPIYRASEQISKDIIGKFTDIYSLGIILFEILTDKRPFKRNSTKETIEAITQGIENLPEFSQLDYRVDPLLANLCKLAINKNYEKRISASEFCKGLSRFALFEANVKSYLFQSQENPMVESDWQSIYTSEHWLLKDGVWKSTKKNQQHLLFWKTPITGNFTFTCEAWITGYHGELSIMCFGKSLKDTTGWDTNHETYKGYCFQFGADNNLYTKLARHGGDILVNPNHTVEVNRKYLITVSYQDDWLRCYIDKEIVFNYRELHPFKGYHIGFYCFNNTSSFKPIEIKYQIAGLMIPSMQSADEHLAFNAFEVAISKYDEIILSFPDRLEALDATLKKGICYAKLGKKNDAIVTFESLKNTILEPYALTELAMMELPTNEYEVWQKNGDYNNAVLIFKKIIDNFPNHQAIFKILTPCTLLNDFRRTNNITFKKNRETTLRCKVELLKLGMKTLTPPGGTQINCFESILIHLTALGCWEEALEIAKLYIIHYKKYLFFRESTYITLLYLHYNADDTKFLFAEMALDLKKLNIFEVHPIIVLENISVEEIIIRYSIKVPFEFWKMISYKIIYNLANKTDTEYVELFDRFMQAYPTHRVMHSLRSTDYLPFEMLLANNKNNIVGIKSFFSIFSKTSSEHAKEATIFESYYNSISDLFEFNYDSCLKNINLSNDFVTKVPPLQEKRLLIACFLYSLDYIGDLSTEELIFQNKIYLVGPRLELANNFLKGEIFTLSEKWPKKITYTFFDNLMYCLWLFEKNELNLCQEILKTLINPIFGDSYFQPFLQKLEIKMKEKM